MLAGVPAYTAGLVSLAAVLACLLATPWLFSEMIKVQTNLREGMEAFNALQKEAWGELVLLRSQSYSHGRHERSDLRCSCDSINRCPPGSSGLPGFDGQDGVPGTDGKSGEPGKPGLFRRYGPTRRPSCIACPQGLPGGPGQYGPQGAPGRPGHAGSKGPPGSPGPNGRAGPPGPPGRTGRNGQPGPKGQKGQAGTRGIPGNPGRQGASGPRGPTGRTGQRGRPGNATASGPSGPPGRNAAAGDKGQPGRRGPQGITGPPGRDAQYCPCPRRQVNRNLKRKAKSFNV